MFPDLPPRENAECAVRIGDPAGLHLRVAAELAAIAERSGCEVTLNECEVRRAIRIVALRIRYGDVVTLRVCGPRAEGVLEELRHVLEGER